MSEKKKKKKEKVTYIDDGRTIADMSALGGYRRGEKPRSSFKEVWKTYWSAVKMMLLPTLVVVGIITLAYLIMYFSLKGF
ncbi:MAG: hypothetical protein J6B29_05565 [Clostridia bacterium]|nr:hypothetical protein [Clostridia bacterium]